MKTLNIFQVITLSVFLASLASCVRVDGMKLYVDDGDPISEGQDGLESDRTLLNLESFEQTIASGHQACGLIKERMELGQSQALLAFAPLIGMLFVEEAGSGEFVFWRFSLGPILPLQGLSVLTVEKLVSESSDYAQASRKGGWITVAGDRVVANEGKSYTVSQIAVTGLWDNRRVITWVERDQTGNDYCQYLAIDFDDDSHLLVSNLVSVKNLPRKSKSAAQFLKVQTWKDLWQNH